MINICHKKRDSGNPGYTHNITTPLKCRTTVKHFKMCACRQFSLSDKGSVMSDVFCRFSLWKSERETGIISEYPE